MSDLSWEEPAPKRAKRHRHRARHNPVDSPPWRLVKAVPRSPKQHQDMASRHRRGGSCSTAGEAVHIIAAAVNGKAYGRKQGIPHKYLLPYDLVEWGDEGKMIKKGEATRDEYVLGLKRMEAQRHFPTHALPVLSAHQETIAQDNCSLPWETFTRIADGRLPQGWDDQAAIDILRIEIIAAAGKVPSHAHGPAPIHNSTKQV